jgi:hypothetical protein
VAGIVCVVGLWLLAPVPSRAATLTVTKCNGNGNGSLPDTIASAASVDTILFDTGLICTGKDAITVRSTLTLSQSVTIDGSGATIEVDGGCILSGTVCNSTGGGVQVFQVNPGVTATLNALTIQHGLATNGFNGGGILNEGTLTVTNSTFLENYGTDGGAIDNAGPSNALTVTSSTFLRNSASVGGSIFNPGTATVTNSTFAGNASLSSGGGIYNMSGGTLTVMNSTLSGNSAATSGGGIFNNGGTATLTNTIVANSTSGGDTFGTIDGTNNLIGGTLLLGPRGTYDGIKGTQTFPLLPGSPAIDQGTATGCPATDQRGVARPVNGACAIGAFESRGFTLQSAGGDGPSTTIAQSFPNPLAVVVSSSHSEPVDGGQITFTTNAGANGQSATLSGSVAAIGNGGASVTATANSKAGDTASRRV